MRVLAERCGTSLSCVKRILRRERDWPLRRSPLLIAPGRLHFAVRANHLH
jgi:hypothetical protein